MAVITRTIIDDITFSDDVLVSNLMQFPFYGSLIDANNYFSTMLEGKKWNSYSSDDRRRALTSATQRIENLNFVGLKSSDSQQLEFPRGGDTQVPVKVKQSCYEIAYALLKGIDLDTERDNTFKSTRGYGGLLSVNRTPESVQPWIVAGIPSSRAWDLLMPFISPRLTLSLQKV